MSETSFVLRPISSDDAALLRRRGGVVYVADSHPGYPCRQCLRDAEVGEELILVSHDPFATASAYRCASPIFLHRHDCGAPRLADEIPDQLRRRQLAVRSYDVDEMMIDAAVIDGPDLAATVRRFFGDGDSHRIHVYNATRGCWALAVDRAT